MSAERDELARVIKDNRTVWATNTEHNEMEAKQAEAILAAGYRKPRTITTMDELDALGAKSAILDAEGTPWVGDGDKIEPWASVCEDPFGGPIWKDSRDIQLPATVLHEPS